MASNLVVDTLSKGAVTLNTDELVDTNSTQVCKAWVNFNGSGTVAIRDSYNVSSITDNGTGNYTVNFTTAMPDADYAILSTMKIGTTVTSGMETAPVDTSTAEVKIFRANAAFNSGVVSVAVFR